jgi:peptidoglycan/LPS O-acetylase OafA/YrhL
MTSREDGAAAAGPPAKDDGVETLRGLAVLLMVAGHVIGNDAETGLRVADDSGWRYAYYTLAPLRMPLFTAISGYVYALRPLGAGGWSRFMAGKVRRLLIPLLVVGSAFVSLQFVTPGANSRVAVGDLPWLLVIPYAHYWYLYALAWVFLLVGTLDALRVLDRPWRWALLLAAALALMASGALATPVLGIGHAQYLLPYFLLGLGVRRFSLRRGWPVAVALAALGAAGLILHQGGWAGWWELEGLERYAVTTLLGAVGVVGLLTWRVPWRPLATLGTFSYGIYLMHVFGTAAARIALQRAGVTAMPIHLLAGVAAGVALPILIERTVARRPWLLLLLLGRRSRRAVPRQPDADAVAV